MIVERSPKIIALSTSLPAPSVPNQAIVPFNILSPGERRESKILTTFKSYGLVGAKIEANNAQNIIKKSKPKEIKVEGLVNFLSRVWKFVPILILFSCIYFISLIDLLLLHVHEDQEMRTLYPQSSLELETK